MKICHHELGDIKLSNGINITLPDDFKFLKRWVCRYNRLTYQLEVVLSDKTRNTLRGIDWLKQFQEAFDRENLYFDRDNLEFYVC